MKIKKISEQINYREVTTEHFFEVNGKKVSVIEWSKQDNVNNDYEDNTEILEKDKLTDIELEAIGENMVENLELKDGEEWDTD